MSAGRPSVDEIANSVFGVIKHIVEVQVTLKERGVVDSTSLDELDENTFHSICNRTLRAYDLVIGFSFIKGKYKPSLKTSRAQLTHSQKTLNGTDATKGFDTLSSKEYWDNHFSPNGGLSKLSSIIDTYINNNEVIKVKIENLKIKSLNTPQSKANIEEQIKQSSDYLDELSVADKTNRFIILGYIDWFGEILKSDLEKLLLADPKIDKKSVNSSIQRLIESKAIIMTKQFYLSNKSDPNLRRVYEKSALFIADTIINKLGLA